MELTTATAKPRPRTRPKAPEPRQLLNAACRIVADGGWAALTLRPLAESLEVSVTVLSNHYGTRADVVAAICAAALAAEEHLFGGWHAMLARLGPLDAATAADLGDTILEQLAVAERSRSLLFLEALQASSWDDELRAVFAPWRDARMGFWAGLGRQASMLPEVADSGWLGGYFIDELAYSICLHHLPSYRMLRRLCLRRLFGAARTGSGEASLFAALFEGLDYQDGEIAVSHGAQIAADWPGRAAQASALALVERGVSALTHRAIAAAAGVPHTTLSYRFPTQHDLVVAGLEYIISNVMQAVGGGEDAAEPPRTLARLRTGEGGLDVGRATFALALAAARMPRLVPGAADMRRCRGINLLKLLQRETPPLPGLDLLAAQVASIGLIGFTHTLPNGARGDYARAHGAMLAYLRTGSSFDQASPGRHPAT
ncbi:TetR family transcriptional regulator [Massilia sp. HP4]|uniref:TetR family transcriptional regulator n=1 Tax=Massilia sp. HP4 TaxID=2562316 RepID=UPI00148515A4|nr:TetR family transcriptional regulator [Massilia sp. HP4]